MATAPKVFLILSAISFLGGFSGLLGPGGTGLGKALGCVFFILFFIFHSLAKENAKYAEEVAAHSGEREHGSGEAARHDEGHIRVAA